MNIYNNKYLPGHYQTSLIDPSQIKPLTNVVPHETNHQQHLQMRFIEQLDRQQLQTMHNKKQIESTIRNYEITYHIQSTIPKLLNIHNKSKTTQSLYKLDSPIKKTTNYKHQCLLTHHLIKQNIRFIKLTCLPHPNKINQNNNP